MRNRIMLLGSLLALSACSAITAGIPRTSSDVLVADNGARAHGNGHARARSVKVPPGHYPPAGQCRVWYMDQPPGHQPAAARCERLVGHVPAGAFLLYNGRAWDTEYDWRGEESRNHGSVPVTVLRIMNSVR